MRLLTQTILFACISPASTSHDRGQMVEAEQSPFGKLDHHLGFILLFVAPQIAGVLLQTSHAAAMLSSVFFEILFTPIYLMCMKRAGRMVRRKR